MLSRTKALLLRKPTNTFYPPANGYYALREWNRKIATAIRTTKSKDLEPESTSSTTTNTSSSSVATPPKTSSSSFSPISTFFHDVDEFFDKSPLFSSSFPLSNTTRMNDLMSHFWRRMDYMDDMRRKRLLFSRNSDDTNYYPNYDIHSDDDKVQVILDLPGVELKDINVNVENDELLHISGHRKTKNKEDGSLFEMKFDKWFNFGGKDVIDSSKILANLANGVLRVSLPKLPSAKPTPENIKKIDVIDGTDELEC